MGIKQFHIALDRPEQSFFAGEIIHGSVQLDLTTHKHIKELRLHWNGVGKIFGGYSVGPATATGSPFEQPSLASEVYFDEQVVLETATDQEAAIGLHSFPFQFQLPTKCPSSFQEPYAQLKYSVQATLYTPSRTHRTNLLPFTVNGVYDLNCVPTQPESAAGHIVTVSSKGQEFKKLSSKLSWLSCFFAPPIGFHIQLPKTCFVPGEFVLFSIEMFNLSRAPVPEVTLALFQESKYQTKDGAHVKSGLRQKLASTAGPSVGPGETEVWETNVEDSLYLQIPSVPPTNLGAGPCHCSLVTLSYYLQFEMEVEGQKSVKGQVPIVVGTVPLLATFKEFVSLAKDKKNNNNSAVNLERSLGPVLGYPELCDPVFEEASTCYSMSAPVSRCVVPGSNPEPDSDEEYLNTSVSTDDFNFIPKYANYTSIYGLELSELMGTPTADATINISLNS